MTIASHIPVVSPALSGTALRQASLTPGQIVEGRVLGPAIDGGSLVQIGRQSMSLSLPTSMTVGTLLSLRVEQADGQLRLALVDTKPPPPAPQLPATNVDISQAGRVPQAPATYAPAITAPTAGLAGAVAASVAAPPLPPAPTGQTSPPLIPPTTAAPQISGAVLHNAGGSPFPAPQPAIPTGTAPMSAPYVGNLPPTLQAASLAQMVQQALPNQSSLGAVTGLLGAALGQVALPEPVLKAARMLLENRLVTKGGVVDPAALKTAVQNSGIFQEAKLAHGAAGAAAGDTKSALLALQKGLVQWLGNQPQIAAAAAAPPPLRNVLPRAKMPETPVTALSRDPEEVGKLLLESTEGALSRLRLHQHASLPDAARPGEALWSMDLPIVVGLQQAVLQLQIHRDGSTESDRPEERGWQVRFAVNLPDLGEVGAQISLRAQTVGIMLWADRLDTVNAFEKGLDDLKATLGEAGLKVGAVVVRRGAPQDIGTAPGRVLDATL